MIMQCCSDDRIGRSEHKRNEICTKGENTPINRMKKSVNSKSEGWDNNRYLTDGARVSSKRDDIEETTCSKCNFCQFHQITERNNNNNNNATMSSNPSHNNVFLPGSSTKSDSNNISLLMSTDSLEESESVHQNHKIEEDFVENLAYQPISRCLNSKMANIENENETQKLYKRNKELEKQLDEARKLIRAHEERLLAYSQLTSQVQSARELKTVALKPPPYTSRPIIFADDRMNEKYSGHYGNRQLANQMPSYQSRNSSLSPKGAFYACSTDSSSFSTFVARGNQMTVIARGKQTQLPPKLCGR